MRFMKNWGWTVLGVVAVICGIRAWMASRGGRGSAALGVAGTGAGITGLIAWIIAGGDLLAVLGVFR